MPSVHRRVIIVGQRRVGGRSQAHEVIVGNTGMMSTRPQRDRYGKREISGRGGCLPAW
jgi:hypothetical protein